MWYNKVVREAGMMSKKTRHVVDPETGKVVGAQRTDDEKDPYDTTTPSYKFASAMYDLSGFCFFLFAVSAFAVLFIPEDWYPYAGIVAVSSGFLWCFSKLIWRYKHEIQDEKVDKFELTTARLTLICAFLTVPFGIAAFVLPNGWARYAAGVAFLSIILACIGNSAWRSERWDRKFGGKRK